MFGHERRVADRPLDNLHNATGRQSVAEVGKPFDGVLADVNLGEWPDVILWVVHMPVAS